MSQNEEDIITLSSLPLFIQASILERLSDANDIARVQAVCKLWKDVVTNKCCFKHIHVAPQGLEPSHSNSVAWLSALQHPDTTLSLDLSCSRCGGWCWWLLSCIHSLSVFHASTACLFSMHPQPVCFYASTACLFQHCLLFTSPTFYPPPTIYTTYFTPLYFSLGRGQESGCCHCVRHFQYNTSTLTITQQLSLM